jgi:DNA-binding MltR family transcriptional regulator
MWMHNKKEARSLAAAIKEIETSTDRAAAIVAAAFVEDHLTTALRRRFHQDEKILDELFRGTGPLAPYSTKIKLAYLMGMFSEQTASEIHYIRKIRNEFAHNIETDSFSCVPIKDWTANLTLVDRYNVEIDAIRDDRSTTVKLSLVNEDNRPALKTARGRFIITCQCLLSIFMLDSTPAIEAPHV